MKIFHIPSVVKALIFDIDSTLYTNPRYAKEQVDCQIRHYSDLHGLTHEEGRALISAYRKQWAQLHGDSKISLGNTLTTFGISISQSIAWREQLIEPANFLAEDTRLHNVLQELKQTYKLICVTNNPVLPARKTLNALGISNCIEHIVGLDTCEKSKPAEEPFLLAARLCDCAPEECISIGDRYDIDLALPLQLGMGGILVNGVEDVYKMAHMRFERTTCCLGGSRSIQVS